MAYPAHDIGCLPNPTINLSLTAEMISLHTLLLRLIIETVKTTQVDVTRLNYPKRETSASLDLKQLQGTVVELEVINSDVEIALGGVSRVPSYVERSPGRSRCLLGSIPSKGV